MSRLTKLAAVSMVVSLALAGCGTEDTKAGGKAQEAKKCSQGVKNPKIGLAYDIGGRGDKSFNDLAAKAVDKSVKDLGTQVKESKAILNESDASKEERLRTFGDAGYNPIIAVGAVYTEEVQKVAAEYPDICFAVVDGFAEGGNVTNLVFAPEQGAFLVGVAAGLKTKTDKLGFVGGVKGPVIDPFGAGFEAGVKAVNPKAKVSFQWLSNALDDQAFKNPTGGKAKAKKLFEDGADIVFHAAGASGNGVIEAAVEAGKDHWAIGVDSDQWLVFAPKEQAHILTSSLKRVDTATYDFIAAFIDGTAKPGFDLYDLKRDGVGYATSGGHIDDIVPKLEEYKKKIVSGEIKVPKEFSS